MASSWSINAGYQASLNTLARMKGLDVTALKLDGDPGRMTKAALGKVAEAYGIDIPADASLQDQMAAIRNLTQTTEFQKELTGMIDGGEYGPARAVLAFANDDPALEAKGTGFNDAQTKTALEQYTAAEKTSLDQTASAPQAEPEAEPAMQPAPDPIASPDLAAAPSDARVVAASFQPESNAPAKPEEAQADEPPVIDTDYIQTEADREALREQAQQASDDTAALEVEADKLETEIYGPEGEEGPGIGITGTSPLDFDEVLTHIETTGDTLATLPADAPAGYKRLVERHDGLLAAEQKLDSYLAFPMEVNAERKIVGAVGGVYGPIRQEFENDIAAAQNQFMEEYADMPDDRKAEVAAYVKGESAPEPVQQEQRQDPAVIEPKELQQNDGTWLDAGLRALKDEFGMSAQATEMDQSTFIPATQQQLEAAIADSEIVVAAIQPAADDAAISYRGGATTLSELYAAAGEAGARSPADAVTPKDAAPKLETVAANNPFKIDGSNIYGELAAAQTGAEIPENSGLLQFQDIQDAIGHFSSLLQQQAAHSFGAVELNTALMGYESAISFGEGRQPMPYDKIFDRTSELTEELGYPRDQKFHIDDPQQYSDLLKAVSAYANDISVGQLPGEFTEAFDQAAGLEVAPEEPAAKGFLVGSNFRTGPGGF